MAYSGRIQGVPDSARSNSTTSSLSMHSNTSLPEPTGSASAAARTMLEHLPMARTSYGTANSYPHAGIPDCPPSASAAHVLTPIDTGAAPNFMMLTYETSVDAAFNPQIQGRIEAASGDLRAALAAVARMPRGPAGGYIIESFESAAERLNAAQRQIETMRAAHQAGLLPQANDESSESEGSMPALIEHVPLDVPPPLIPVDSSDSHTTTPGSPQITPVLVDPSDDEAFPAGQYR